MPKNSKGRIFEYFAVSGLDYRRGLEPFTTGLESCSLEDEDSG